MFVAFKRLERNTKYERDLNVVYKHKECGHIFSLGDPWIIEAYLAGDLVPRDLVITHDEATALREEISELRAQLSSQVKQAEGRLVT